MTRRKRFVPAYKRRRQARELGSRYTAWLTAKRCGVLNVEFLSSELQPVLAPSAAVISPA